MRHDEAEISLARPSLPGADEPLVKARSVLLTGLSALEPQREALTVIGAQAVLEHTYSLDKVPITLTTDADTSISPSIVDSSFDIGEAMLAAGFIQHKDRPGIWGLPEEGGETVNFDILAPGAVAGPGRRGARITGQDRRAIGRADGLELSLLDREMRRIEAFDGSGRTYDAYIAGPAALLCAKSYKLAERLAEADRGGRNRVKAKDASDVCRLMMVSNPAHVKGVFTEGERDPVIGPAIRKGRRYLEELFEADGAGVWLAVRGFGADGSSEPIRGATTSWMTSFERS